MPEEEQQQDPLLEQLNSIKEITTQNSQLHPDESEKRLKRLKDLEEAYNKSKSTNPLDIAIAEKKYAEFIATAPDSFTEEEMEQLDPLIQTTDKNIFKED
jgi:hypothetical protein